MDQKKQVNEMILELKKAGYSLDEMLPVFRLAAKKLRKKYKHIVSNKPLYSKKQIQKAQQNL